MRAILNRLGEMAAAVVRSALFIGLFFVTCGLPGYLRSEQWYVRQFGQGEKLIAFMLLFALLLILLVVYPILYFSSPTDAHLRRLRETGKLHTLTHGPGLGSPDASDAGMAELRFVGDRVTDAGLKELGGLRALAILRVEVRFTLLHRAAITGAGLASLRDLLKLRLLILDHTRVTDAGLRELGQLTGLTSLSLRGTLVTDAGLGELQSLTNLRSLHLEDTAVSEAGAASLRAILPDCEVNR